MAQQCTCSAFRKSLPLRLFIFSSVIKLSWIEKVKSCLQKKKKPTVKCRHFKVANFQVIFQWECKVNDYNIFLHSNETQNQWFIAGKRMKIILVSTTSQIHLHFWWKIREMWLVCCCCYPTVYKSKWHCSGKLGPKI